MAPCRLFGPRKIFSIASALSPSPIHTIVYLLCVSSSIPPSLRRPYAVSRILRRNVRSTTSPPVVVTTTCIRTRGHDSRGQTPLSRCCPICYLRRVSPYFRHYPRQLLRRTTESRSFYRLCLVQPSSPPSLPSSSSSSCSLPSRPDNPEALSPLAARRPHRERNPSIS